MLRRVRCPVCSVIMELSITRDMVQDKKEFPVSVRIDHEDHHFYVNLDSEGSITDILHPDLCEPD
ncbi:MAG: hypothetical protein GF309_10785 [Candidatus Lokiarchaeota archaeon]|nr:hypothetical protein [Candidatus Lokiarchaeota archaeon]